MALIMGGSMLFYHNRNQPEAKDDYIYKFSNCNGIQLKCRLPHPCKSDKFIILELKDVKQCSIMNLPYTSF